ncbi:Chaperone protein dnaJ 39 [Acorus gramineus]|uniref:Chaperone protein dnaJ 39 n=1 Tax=Acorus gramineus TaxID=55184 RepID=A0AAV9BQ38_ACOGR|nr:Chaperone protein dnaJ 39 [Acorus gramineus]
MNPIGGDFGGAFASRTPATGGLSRPRFVKVRRNLASPRVRPVPSAAAAEGASSGGFNPFRSGTDGHDQSGTDGGTSCGGSVGGFVFGGSTASKTGVLFGSNDTSRNPMFGLSGVSEYKLPQQMGKLNIGSKAGANLGGDENKLQEEIRKLNIGEGGPQKAKGASFGAETGVKDGFGVGIDVNKLPEEIWKLNFGEGGPEKPKADSSGVKTEVKEAYSVDKQPEVLSKSNDSGYFVFESSTKGGSVSGQSSHFGVDGSAVSRLPDEMGKLNIEGSGAGGRFTETTGNNIFIFGSKNTFDLSDATRVHILPEEMKKLNIDGSDVVKSSMDFGEKNGFVFSASSDESFSKIHSGYVDTKDSEKTGFVFGGIKNGSGHFGVSTVNEFPDEMRSLSGEGLSKDNTSTKSEESGFDFKAGEQSSFVFGSQTHVTGSFGRETVSLLPDEMKKSNIESGTNTYFTFPKSSGDVKPTNVYDNAMKDASTPISFTFQTGNCGKDSGRDPVHQVQTNYNSSTTEFYTPLSHFSSSDTSVPDAGDFFKGSSVDGSEKKGAFTFSTPGTSSKMSREDSFHSFWDNSLGKLPRDLEFISKRGATKDKKSRKKKGKLRPSVPIHDRGDEQAAMSESGSLENLEPDDPGSYSPMDFSPYYEPLVDYSFSRETSVASEEPIKPDLRESISLDAKENDLPQATMPDMTSERVIENILNDGTGRRSEHSSFEEGVSGREKQGFSYETDKPSSISNAYTCATEPETGFSSTDKKLSDGGTGFISRSSSEDFSETKFTFAAANPVQDPPSISRRQKHYRRKNQMNPAQDSYGSTPSARFDFLSNSAKFYSSTNSSSQLDPEQGRRGISLFPASEQKRPEADKELNNRKQEFVFAHRKEEFGTSSAASVAAQEACEKWRLRGNQAYANGEQSKAEEHYTRGIRCISPNETSQSCAKALMLCYSNRAATRMSLGRIREALGDCMMATAIDPSFFKAHVRAANCHLSLGEIEDAMELYKRCLQSVGLDQKIISEASEGLRKAQQLAEYMDQSVELLRKRTSKDATNALQVIGDALMLSPFSDTLVEMKAEALLMLRRYDEVIQLCEQTQDSAERNFSMINADGRLEEALDLLEKHEKILPITKKYESESVESSIAVAVTVRELLRLKAAGNEEFQAGRYSEAIEHYTAALTCSVESRPFAAVCFCNRAAAYQALGQFTDAIADCSLAIALDANYQKAISRRATLYEMIRDYGQATIDLCRLVSLLEKKTQNKDNQPRASGKSANAINDLKQARSRLAVLEEESKRETPLNMYLILGIESSSTASDIKKAYRRAALRHHPDKACQFLPRSENGDDGLWKEVASEVHKDADRLFKIIGEAYAIVSDPDKRFEYDTEEEIRNTPKSRSNGSTSRRAANYGGYQYAKSDRWRGADSWKSYGSSHRWSESSGYGPYH